MTRRAAHFVFFVVLALSGGCASERAPRTSPAAAPAVDPAAEYLVAIRAGFERAAHEPPELAAATLGRLRGRPIPSGLDANDVAFVRAELDREIALVSLDAGRNDEAVAAIDRALATAEAMSERDPAITAGLLLTAEAVYRQAGKSDAAAWARREAEILITRESGR